MATVTLTQRRPDASPATPVPIEVLAGGRPTTPVILALDLGLRTGWAVRNRDGAIASGVQEFRPGRFDGERHDLAALPWLASGDQRNVGRCRCPKKCVGIWAPARRMRSAVLTAWAEANRIPYQGVPVGTIKRHVAGKGNADKQAVLEAVRKLGFAPADDNEADALALLNWAIAQGIGGAR